MTLKKSPPLSQNPSFLICKKIKTRQPPSTYAWTKYLDQEGGFGFLMSLSFPHLEEVRTKWVCCVLVRRSSSVVGLCLDVSEECVPLKAFKIILAVKLLPGWGPESCHPYQ